jgi:hypothetical protein
MVEEGGETRKGRTDRVFVSVKDIIEMSRLADFFECTEIPWLGVGYVG